MAKTQYSDCCLTLAFSPQTGTGEVSRDVMVVNAYMLLWVVTKNVRDCCFFAHAASLF